MIKKIFQPASRILLLVGACCLQLAARPQSATTTRDSSGYWQQEVHYRINVTLNDASHSLRGDETLEYINHSPDTLSYIWFHLWPNGYKDNTTALYKQLSSLSDRKDKLKKIKENGYIDQLDFTVDGKKIATEPH